MKSSSFRIAAIAVLLLFPFFTGSAQSIFSKSYDPQGDSLAIEKYRQRMDEIRKTRPTVALVLSGGGAKGAAHVGVIRYLEEVGIPVDVVLGTSMGGLVGGLYSAGYTTEAMDSILRNMDWNYVMTDRFDKDYLSYSERKYRDKYVVSIPFYYERQDYIERMSEDKKKPQIQLGAEGEDGGEIDVMKNIVGSLPDGYIQGRNVSNILGGLTVGYQDDIDFLDLPIPYLCIATEMVSGRAKVWTKGKLNTALRSTMSIPGVFAPVRTDGMILVDGGLRNNFPTDFAKEMGVDYIIGVDLSDADMEYSDINNLADIVWQATDIMGRDSFEKNIHIPDIKIKPDLTGYNMMSFSTENIDTIISRGYRAAIAKAEPLAALKEKIGPFTTQLQAKPAVELSQTPVIISAIQYEGLTPAEIAYMEDKLKIGAWDKVTKADLDKAVNTIYGTKAFDSVTYELLGTKLPYVLLLKCRRGPIHQLGISGRFDSESLVSVLFNVGLNKHKIEGYALNLTAKLASNPYIEAAYSYRAPRIPTINADFRYNYTDASLYELNQSGFNICYWNLRQRVYLSDLNLKFARVRGGIKNEFFNISEIMAGYDFADKYSITGYKDDFVSAFVDARHETLDDGYFPKKGHNVAIGYDYVMSSLLRDNKPFHVVGFEATRVFPIGEKFAFKPAAYARMLFGEQIPVPFINLAGGQLAGRYLAHQIPFVGISYATPTDDMVAMVGADFRWNPAKNHYFSLKANVLQTSDSLKPDEFLKGTTLYGGGLEYAYDTIVGPLKFDVHWSNVTHLGAYVSFGFDF